MYSIKQGKYYKDNILLDNNVAIKEAIENLYLIYFNDFLSVDSYCESMNMNKEDFFILQTEYKANFQ